MTDTARIIASPFGRAAVASILALAALSGVAMSRPIVSDHAGLAPHVVASPAALTGELA